ncbi:phosphoglycerate kinase [Clostridia bacterium]|nr:phosphoglycerate kinase [Clostridia bacterium]
MAKLNKKSVEDLNVAGKRVLVRVDFNVPLKDGVITDDNRIRAALPTITKLIEGGAKVILCSHLGKPKEGAASEPKNKFSLAPAAAQLGKLLGKTVVFAADDSVVGENARAAVAKLNNGDVVLLENTRFRKGETKNDEEFSKDLASLADAYVNDAFGSAHRAHSSTVGVAQVVTANGGETAVGYLMNKEIEFLGNAVNSPERPFVAILGGAKVADKLNVISNLLDKADTLIIGGGMAYTFLKAEGKEIGDSLVDDTKLEYCREMLAKAKSLSKQLLLPVDAVITKAFPDPIDAPIATEQVLSSAIPSGSMGLDIGEATRGIFADAIKSAKTVVWNGPMGVFENPILAKGTIAVAEALAAASATTIIGGGDSAAAIIQNGFADKMSHISTGGGASLEYLEGKVLPGIEAIQDK